MDYYGNNDWRDYIAHYGTPRHSGRYPWGSGKNPRQGTAFYYDKKSAPQSYNFSKGLQGSTEYGKRFYSSGGEDLNNVGSTASSTNYDNYKLKLKNKKFKLVKDSELDDIKQVNPNQYTHNCVYCTTAYELRRRGYDVEARFGSDEKYHSVYQTLETFPKSLYSYMECYPRSEEEYKQRLALAASPRGNMPLAQSAIYYMKEYYPVGARGSFNMSFTPQAGHTIGFKIVKDKSDPTGKHVFFYDAQVREIYNEELAKNEFLSHTVGMSFLRLDDSPVNNGSVGKFVKNKG